MEREGENGPQMLLWGKAGGRWESEKEFMSAQPRVPGRMSGPSRAPSGGA